jgi:hypothetical protein
MQLSTVSGESSLRLNTQSRSLWITFLRPMPDKAVSVILLDHFCENRKYNLQVVTADAKGIEVKMPHITSGLYDLKIKDGRKVFTTQVALQ